MTNENELPKIEESKLGLNFITIKHDSDALMLDNINWVSFKRGDCLIFKKSDFKLEEVKALINIISDQHGMKMEYINYQSYYGFIIANASKWAYKVKEDKATKEAKKKATAPIHTGRGRRSPIYKLTQYAE